MGWLVGALPMIASDDIPGLIQLDFAALEWRYIDALQTAPCASDGVEDTDLSWTAATFDDSAWNVGQSPIGWGYHGTSFTPRNVNITEQHELWMRHVLPGGHAGWDIEVKVDNYIFVYFNGHKITGTLPSGAFTGADNGIALKLLGVVPDAWVRPDVNVIALHIQDQLTGYGPGDILIGDAQATAFPPGTIFGDTFNRADNPSSLGGSWTIDSGTWGISSGQVVMGTTTAINSLAHVDPGVGDGQITVDVPAFVGPASSGGWGLAFRYVNSGNCYIADFGTTAPQLFKGVGGSFTSLGAFSDTLAAGDTISVALDGPSIRCRRKRAGVTTTLLAVTDSTYDNTHTKCGLFAFGLDGTSRFDNFRVS